MNISHFLAFGTWSGEGCRLVRVEEGEIVCECDHLTNFGLLLVSQPNWFTPSHFNPFHSLSLFPPFSSPYLNPFKLSPSLPPLGNQPPPPRYGAPSGNYHLRCPHFVHRLPAYHHHYLPYNKVRAVEERKERGERGEGEGKERGQSEGGRRKKTGTTYLSEIIPHNTHTHTQEAARTRVWSDAITHVYLSARSLCLLPGGSAGSTLHNHSWVLFCCLCRTAVFHARLLLLDSSGSSPSLPEAREGVWFRRASLHTVGLHCSMGYVSIIL